MPLSSVVEKSQVQRSITKLCKSVLDSVAFQLSTTLSNTSVICSRKRHTHFATFSVFQYISNRVHRYLFTFFYRLEQRLSKSCLVIQSSVIFDFLRCSSWCSAALRIISELECTWTTKNGNYCESKNVKTGVTNSFWGMASLLSYLKKF